MNIARRLMLNLPICLDDSEHRDRGDGYCNCGYEFSGAPKVKLRSVKYSDEGRPVARGKFSLDSVEGNWEEFGHRGK